MLSNEEVLKIFLYAEGKVISIPEIIRNLDLKIKNDELEKELFFHGIEKCKRCGTWYRLSDLCEDEKDDDGYAAIDYCDTCRG